MSYTSILFVALSSVFVLISAQKYPTRYENVNVEDVLKNTRLLNGYVRCLMDKGRCTVDGAELKRILPDALATRCMSCSPKQKVGITRIIAYLTANRPDVWRELRAKYDPYNYYMQQSHQVY